MADIWLYLKLLRDKWPLSVPAGLTAVLAALTAAIGPKHPLLLPPIWWLLLTVGCVVVAQFLVWRDVRSAPVRPEHAEVLRVFATRLRGTAFEPYPDHFVAQMFAAHFPEIVEMKNEVERCKRAEDAAYAALVSHISETSEARFPSTDGWLAPTIAQHFIWCIGARDGLTLASDLGHFDTEDSRQLTWNNSIILWNPKDSEARVRDVRAWILDIGKSDAARTYLGAQRRTKAADDRFGGAIDPIMFYRSIRKARTCPVCQGK